MAMLDQYTWIPFKNVHASLTVPPFGIMEVTGVTTVSDATLLTCTQPTTTFQRFYAVNGEFSVKPGGGGRCNFGPSLVARYDTASTPAFGQSWGAKPSSWDLFPNRPGFEVLGLVSEDYPVALPIIHALQFPVSVLKCNPDANITSSGSGDAALEMGGIEAGGFADITLVNDFISNGETISAGKKVVARYFPDEGEWHQIERECE